MCYLVGGGLWGELPACLAAEDAPACLPGGWQSIPYSQPCCPPSPYGNCQQWLGEKRGDTEPPCHEVPPTTCWLGSGGSLHMQGGFPPPASWQLLCSAEQHSLAGAAAGEWLQGLCPCSSPGVLLSGQGCYRGKDTGLIPRPHPHARWQRRLWGQKPAFPHSPLCRAALGLGSEAVTDLKSIKCNICTQPKLFEYGYWLHKLVR